MIKKLLSIMLLLTIVTIYDNGCIFTFDTHDLQNVSATNTGVLYQFDDNTGYYMEY